MLSDCVKKREPRWRNGSQQVLLLPPPKFGIQADATKSRLMFSYSVSSDGTHLWGEEKHAFPLPSFLTSCWTPTERHCGPGCLKPGCSCRAFSRDALHRKVLTFLHLPALHSLPSPSFCLPLAFGGSRSAGLKEHRCLNTARMILLSEAQLASERRERRLPTMAVGVGVVVHDFNPST